MILNAYCIPSIVLLAFISVRVLLGMNCVSPRPATNSWDFPGGSVVKSLPASAGDTRGAGFSPWVGKISWGRAWQPTPGFLPGESHGQRSRAGYRPWGRQESDTTEQLSNAHSEFTG